MILDSIKVSIKESLGGLVSRLNTKLNGKNRYIVKNTVEADVFTQDGEYITSLEIPQVINSEDTNDEYESTELRVSELEREIVELRDNMNEVSKMTKAWGNKEEKK